MAGPLQNRKYELFAQELAKGKTQVEAYTSAGYKPNESHACRLVSNGKISERVAELLDRAAAKTEMSIADMARQLDEDREFARKLESPAAAISASMGKAKVLGLIRERVEHTGKDGGAIEIDQVNSDADAFTRTVVGLAARRGAGSAAGKTQH